MSNPTLTQCTASYTKVLAERGMVVGSIARLRESDVPSLRTIAAICTEVRQLDYNLFERITNMRYMLDTVEQKLTKGELFIGVSDHLHQIKVDEAKREVLLRLLSDACGIHCALTDNTEAKS